MEELDRLLRALVDEPDDYQREGALALLVRHGQQLELRFRQVPGSGLSIVEGSPPQERYVPIRSYIQREILRLPLLAKQIVRALDRSWARRPARFVDGPAQESTLATVAEIEAVAVRLRERLLVGEPDTTHIVQLMARAGQGKTALLEYLATEFARGYQPEPYPQPVLLPVDLLGRFVGTVDDAIAGTLNNTYVFPGLSQRDVALCIQERWIVLALDGFDELVARVGLRDAFLRITELLDQLRGRGSVILSARESFFELYRVTAGIRSYLEPKVGSYTTTAVKLLQWREKQGLEVFRSLGSEDPGKDLEGLLSQFDGDREIVFHPFFLTRLAAHWRKGERFDAVGVQGDVLGRMKYVIETTIQRESEEKWKSRDGSPLLSVEAHTHMLGGVAAEMWRSGAFRLDVTELTLASELGLEPLHLGDDIVQDALARVPNHAALTLREQRYSFLHNKFLDFFLGHRLANLLGVGERNEVVEILGARDLNPDLLDWVVWNWQHSARNTQALVAFLNEVRADVADGTVGGNLAGLCARLLRNEARLGPVEVKGQVFVGEMLAGGRYVAIRFEDCRLWHLDLSGTLFDRCVFARCRVGDILIDGATRFEATVFTDCIPTALEVRGDRVLYSPEDIGLLLEHRGAKLPAPPAVVTKAEATLPAVRPEAVACVVRLVRLSERTCDVALEDAELGRLVRDIARVGVKEGVLRSVTRAARGPKKTFVRFTVDREKLLRGQAVRTGDGAIDGFWAEIVRRFPVRA